MDNRRAKHAARMHRFRIKASKFRSTILTALGIPRGFFVQYPYASSFQAVRSPYPEVEALFERSNYIEFLEVIESFGAQMSTFGRLTTDPVLGRGMFPALDGMAAYSAVRKFRPQQIIEIGSGDSTYFLARGIADNGSGVLTCIDPSPRRDIRSLNVAIENRLLEVADANLAEKLQPNDILFIDSSHIMLPSMDVDIQFNRMFPKLKPGVIVHIHDIFLPDEYPESWSVRHYSEQSALIGWLVSGYFEVIWPGQYAVTRNLDRVGANLSSIAELGSAGSLWLRKR